MSDDPLPETPPAPEIEEPTPDPAALFALAIRRGLARGLCGLGLSVGFVLAGWVAMGLDGRFRLIVFGLGACIGLGLAGQALLEHALRWEGNRSWPRRLGTSLACWAFGSGVVLLAFAQAFALPHLWDGDPQHALSDALDICRRLLLEKPEEGVTILLALGSPYAFYSVLTLHGWRLPGLLSFVTCNVLFAIPLHLALGHEAGVFQAFLAATALALPVFRALGDWLESRFGGWVTGTD